MRLVKSLSRVLLPITLFAAILGIASDRMPRHVARSDREQGATREAARNEAWERREWMRERFGGELNQDFGRRVLTEAAKERAKHPEHFRDTSGGLANPLPGASEVWRNLGPTSSNKIQNFFTLDKVNSGRLRRILPHPTDPNTVYVLSAGGGLWKTTNFMDAQPTWFPKTDFIGSTTGGGVAFGQSPTTLYLGTGDPFDVGVGGFVVTSTDGGDTWSAPVALGSANKVLDLEVDTSVGDTVLAGTNAGLFRSRDGGVSFTDVGAPFTGLKVWGLLRTSAGWLAAATTQDAFGDDLAASMYVSADHGVSWSPIPNAGNVFSGASRTTIASGTPGDSVVYAFAAGVPDAGFNYPQLDLFRSNDGGLDWTALHIDDIVPAGANSDNPDMRILGGQAWYNQMLLVDPTDTTRNTVYLGGQLASAQSLDGGASWTILTNWLAQFGLPYAHADFHTAAFSAVGGVRRLFFGNDGGLFVSTDDGLTWDDSKNRGLITHLPYTIASNPVAGDTDSVLMGTQDNGTLVRVGGSSVFDQTKGGDGLGVAWSQANNAVSMTSTPFGSIYRCIANPPDDQSKWVSSSSGLGDTPGFYTLVDNAQAPADPTGLVFYTTRQKSVWQTSNGGASWTTILASGSGGVSADRGVRGGLFMIGTSPVDTQHLAVIGNTRFWISTTGGAPWTELDLSASIPGWQERGASSAEWANNDLLYVSSETAVAGATRFAKTIDGGVTWTAPTNAGLPDLPVTRIRVDSGDATGNTLYAATWIGVYKTTDGGATWNHFGVGLPQVPIDDIYIAPGTAYIRVAAYGRGAWELTVVGPPDATITTVASAVQGQQDLLASAPSQPGVTYSWTISGGSITSGRYDSTLTYAAGTGTSLTLGLTVTSAAGLTASSSLVVPITPAPPPDATITAPAVTTQGAGGLVASVPFQIAATYAWSIVDGRITSATDGRSIVFAAGAQPSLTLRVVVTNGAGKQQVGVKHIDVLAAPPPDTTITADALVNHGATRLHASVPAQPGATYAWTIDGGGISSRVDGPAIVYNVTTLERTLTLNVTVINGGGLTLSSSRLLQVQRNGQYLGNPGFEAGGFWQASDPRTLTNTFTSLAHSGVRAALINGYGFANTGNLSQTVTLPADAYAVRLRFWLRVNTADTSPVAHDILTLQVRDTAGNPLQTLATYSNRDRIASRLDRFYRWKTFDLTAYRGQTIQIYFEGVEDNSLLTRFLLDDFTLDVLAPPAPSGEYLLNGGMEAASLGWQGSAEGTVFLELFNDGVFAHSGLWYAYIDGYGFAATDTLFQGVTIPPTATSARFSYWLSVMTDEPGPGANDILTVQVLDSSGSLLDTLATRSNLDAGPYAQYSFDLSPYRGQAIVLLMTGTENDSLQTSFFMDDFSLQVTTPPLPVAPDASITAPSTAFQGARALTASVPDQPAATYTWTLSGDGGITSGAGTHAITFDAGRAPNPTLEVVVTNELGRSRGSHLIRILRPPNQ